MAHYVVIDDIRAGMPSSAVVAGGRVVPFAPRGIACHTPEWAENDPDGLIEYLIRVAATRNAGYSELWYRRSGGFEARRIVPLERCAHSMNPNPPPNGPWSPNARVKRILGNLAWNPNGHSYAVSVMGFTADTHKLVADPGFMAGARRRYAELLAQFRASLAPDPMYNHGEGQTNRTDWGTLLRPAILEEDDDMPTLTRYALETIRIDANASIRSAPTLDGGSLLFSSGRASSAVRVGTVIGDEHAGSREWSVYWQGGGWAYTHEVNVLSVEPYEAGDADCGPAVQDATNDATAKINAAWRSRIESLLETAP